MRGSSKVAGRTDLRNCWRFPGCHKASLQFAHSDSHDPTWARMNCSQLGFCSATSTSRGRERGVSWGCTASADAQFWRPRTVLNTGWNFSGHLRDLGPQLSSQSKDLRIHDTWIALKLQPLFAHGSEEKWASGAVFPFTLSCSQPPPLVKKRKRRWNEMERREDGQGSLHLSYARKDRFLMKLWDGRASWICPAVIVSLVPLHEQRTPVNLGHRHAHLHFSQDCVTVGSHRRRMKLLNSQNREIYFFFPLLSSELSPALSLCMPRLPSELEWHVCASFVFTTLILAVL